MHPASVRVIVVTCALSGCQAIAGLDDFSDRTDAMVSGSSGGTGSAGAPTESGGTGQATGGSSGTSGSGGRLGTGGSNTSGAGGGLASGGASSGGALGSGGAATGGALGSGGAVVSCAGGTKVCGTTCAPLDDPATGCGAATCTPCSTNHATAQCVQNACAILACTANNFQDCDKDPKNGCEADLINDPLHCGSCAKNCRALLNAAPDNQCQGAQCAIDSRIGCKGGWLSCDNNPDNGCEKASEPNNCSDCGDVCASGMACRTHAFGSLCECTNDAACNWGHSGTCVPDPQDSQYMNCHCDALYCGPPGRCGDPNMGQTCKYFP